MRREPEFFGDQELVLIHIAKRLRDALKLEELLTAAQVEYLVEPDTYRGGIIFPSERVGAFFYVAEAMLPQAREVLRANFYKEYKAS